MGFAVCCYFQFVLFLIGSDRFVDVCRWLFNIMMRIPLSSIYVIGWLGWKIIENVIAVSDAVVDYSLYNFGKETGFVGEPRFGSPWLGWPACKS